MCFCTMYVCGLDVAGPGVPAGFIMNAVFVTNTMFRKHEGPKLEDGFMAGTLNACLCFYNDFDPAFFLPRMVPHV